MIKVLFLFLIAFNIYLFVMVNPIAKSELWRVTVEIPSRIVQVSENLRHSLEQAQSQSENTLVTVR
jgi:type IV secretory pathway TrbL component